PNPQPTQFCGPADSLSSFTAQCTAFWRAMSGPDFAGYGGGYGGICYRLLNGNYANGQATSGIYPAGDKFHDKPNPSPPPPPAPKPAPNPTPKPAPNPNLCHVPKYGNPIFPLTGSKSLVEELGNWSLGSGANAQRLSVGYNSRR